MEQLWWFVYSLCLSEEVPAGVPLLRAEDIPPVFGGKDRMSSISRIYWQRGKTRDKSREEVEGRAQRRKASECLGRTECTWQNAV